MISEMKEFTLTQNKITNQIPDRLQIKSQIFLEITSTTFFFLSKFFCRIDVFFQHHIKRAHCCLRFHNFLDVGACIRKHSNGGNRFFSPPFQSEAQISRKKKSNKKNILEKAFINSLSTLTDSSPFLFLVQALGQMGNRLRFIGVTFQYSPLQSF